MPITLQLGNTAVVEMVKAPDESPDAPEGAETHVKAPRPEIGNSVTTVNLPDDWDLAERLRAVGELWPWHSDDPPEWVESDDRLLAQVVAAQFTSAEHECVVGRPDGWQEG